MSPSLWNGYGSFICLRVYLLNYNSSGLNFLLLALPGLHSAAQVYKVIFNSYYKSRFMSLFLLFSMKWLCRIFPFTPLLSLYYFYFPPLSCLRNLIFFSGSSCRKLAYSSHHPIHTTSFRGLCPGKAHLPKSSIVPREHNTIQPTRCKHIHNNSIII